MTAANKTIRLGARGSLLSRMQSAGVARELEKAHPGLKVELVVVSTSGDQIQDRPLHEFGGKGLFTKELELALINGKVDFAVHSFKDVPVTMPLVDTSGLIMAAVPKREDAGDVLVSFAARSLAELAPGARVGTGSLRRQAQVLSPRPDIQVMPIRGNVDTRIRKLKDGEFDAVILAMAGLKRAGLFDAACMTVIDIRQMLPAAGQGALALQCRRDDHKTIELLAMLNDAQTATAVDMEREVIRLLKGDCHSPIGAYAQVIGEHMTLKANVAGRDGRPPVIWAETDVLAGHESGAAAIVVKDLLNQGARKLLDD